MSSGPSGKHQQRRRSISSQHWPHIDRAAIKLGYGSGSALVSRLLAETITDTPAAIETCRRIMKARSEHGDKGIGKVRTAHSEAEAV